MQKKIAIKSDEFWYPGVINDGYLFPLSDESEYYFDFRKNPSYNQVTPILLSNKGRALVIDEGIVKIEGGTITVEAKDIAYYDRESDLQDIYKFIAKRYFKAENAIPDTICFTSPQYCTWMVLKTNQNQQGILRYARNILKAGYKPGILIIDDTWQIDYGDWEFNHRFEDPKSMVDELKSKGFKVVLWLVPYISPDSTAFKELSSFDGLLRCPDGELATARWWNADSYVVDLKNKRTVDWFSKKLRSLQDRYGIDGFKLDGGDESFLPDSIEDGQEHNELWATFYDCNIKELRSCYKCNGMAILQRLADKAHIWGVDRIYNEESKESFLRYGLSTVVPNSLLQGLFGYWYSCPDMVGGGLYVDFDKYEDVDKELFFHSLANELLMPALQFSYPIWEKDEVLRERIGEMLLLRENFVPYILSLIESASKTHEPVVRYLEYQFPHQGFERVTDMFMLGDKYLVAPANKPGQREREIRFPKGTWRNYYTGEIYSGGSTVSVSMDKLPIFINE